MRTTVAQENTMFKSQLPINALLEQKVEADLRVSPHLKLTFLKNAYSGCYSLSPEALQHLIKKYFSHTLIYGPGFAAEDLQFKFLYICVTERYLQNSCARTDCKEIGLKKRHSVIEHLKALFFNWSVVKYGKLGWNIPPKRAGEDVVLNNLLVFLYNNFKKESLKEDIVLASMVATILHFVTDNRGYKGYDICGMDAHFFLDLHSWIQEPRYHPYVRLGGVLQREIFCLDCRYFDMRGVDFAGTRFYGAAYADIDRELFLPTAERQERLLSAHANFSYADLRSANLSRTQFKESKALFNTRLDNILTDGSNIDRYRPQPALV